MTVTDTPNKLKGFDFWKTSLKSAKYVVAPMVDQSELAWRMLTRKYNAELCYTPMFHARMFGDPKNPGYKNEVWHTLPEDRPLVVQFCANKPDELLRAAKLIENECDAVDINLGCPQHIAKRGHYGSFLQDEWELIEQMVRTLDENLAVPVTCKIRIFPDVEKTIRYAKMLENAGCQLLTVHGRLREQKGHNTGLADWEQIKRVKEAVNIPVFANGNILYHEDVTKCIEQTGVEGVMSAEATLCNPALFSGKEVPLWVLGEEYMELCKLYEKSNKNSYIKAHLFKLYRQCLTIHTDIREQLAKAKGLSEYEQVIKALNDRLKEIASKHTEPLDYSLDENGFKKLPYWIAQSYIRPPPGVNESKNKVLQELSKKAAKVNGNTKDSLKSESEKTAESTAAINSKTSHEKDEANPTTTVDDETALNASNGKRKLDETD